MLDKKMGKTNGEQDSKGREDRFRRREWLSNKRHRQKLGRQGIA
jgi:hypothetical protein